MPNILVRGLDAETIKRLKAKAKEHGRSLEGEVKMLIERGAGVQREQIAAILNRWETRFAGRRFTSNARLVREGRRR